jgi:hypothetical protein
VLDYHHALLRRQYPLVEEIFFIDIRELQASTTSLILDFGCINFILGVCVLLTLQMQPIAFEGGVKGIIVNIIIVIL